ncbi:MAG: hypothetical protein AAF249_13950 [Pseudomonadota bacterium]
MTVLSIAAFCAAAVAALTSSTAYADSWAPPTTETYTSENGEYRFTVEPAPIDSALDFFREEVKAQEEGREVERPAPLGLLEKRMANGDWSPVWAVSLVNVISPVSVLVADDGAHVVTFDNWHSIGRGENVIVIYGDGGAMVRSLMLSDVLGETFVAALPESVSSTSWNRGKRLLSDGETLEIDILEPEAGVVKRKRETLPIRIALADGSVGAMTGSGWDRARARAIEVKAMREEARRKRDAFFRDPLIGPSTCDRRPWYQYINEAFLRLTPGNPYSDFTSATVLFPRDHDRYAESVGWLRDKLEDAWGYPRSEAFASPCDPEALVQAVASIARRAQKGAWPDATFYVVATEGVYKKVAQLLAPSGANLVWVDPTTAIPQRPERIPGTPENEAALKADREVVMDSLDAM